MSVTSVPTPKCRWCGNETWTHLGTCPRIKSVRQYADGSETIELWAAASVYAAHNQDDVLLGAVVEVCATLTRIEHMLDKLSQGNKRGSHGKG